MEFARAVYHVTSQATRLSASSGQIPTTRQDGYDLMLWRLPGDSI